MFLNILVIRFSAFGDVAMTVPAVYSVAKAYPNHVFYVLTSKSFETLFINQLPNIRVIAVDLKQYKGLKGLWKLGEEIRKNYDIHAVADLHDVLRSKFLRTYFLLYGKQVHHIDKGRVQKRAITKHTAPLTPLKHTIDRYRDVFSHLKLPAEMSFVSYFENEKGNTENLTSIPFDASKTNLGFAPFAKHAEKMYPIDKMEEVVKALLVSADRHIYLFGGGGDEERKMKEWESKYPNVTMVIGKLSLENELILMSHLSLLVSMDSANMHLASLVNTPVVSVWGATHPFLGFYGYNQDPANAVQIDLDCRPCSVFGDVPCWRGDHACMEWLPPEMIVERVEEVLKKEKAAL